MRTTIEMAFEAGVAFDSEEYPDIWMTYMNVGRKEIEAFAAIVRAEAQAEEREAIYSEWHSCVMADLENGVKWLNEKAAAEWHKNYPAQSKTFPAWIEARGQA